MEKVYVCANLGEVSMELERIDRFGGLPDGVIE